MNFKTAVLISMLIFPLKIALANPTDQEKLDCTSLIAAVKESNNGSLFPNFDNPKISAIFEDDFFPGLYDNVYFESPSFPQMPSEECKASLYGKTIDDLNILLRFSLRTAELNSEPEFKNKIEKIIKTTMHLSVSLSIYCGDNPLGESCLKSLETEYSNILLLDDLLAEIFSLIAKQVTTIESRFLNGLIPGCIVDKNLFACQESPEDDSCRQAIWKLWADSLRSNTLFKGDLPILAEISPYQQGVTWNLEPKSFYHLLFSQAATCGDGTQEGGTCVIYSGSSLLSHYCETPARNPNAEPGTCQQGPNFCCPDKNTLLNAAYELGLWRVHQIGPNGEDTGAVEGAPLTEEKITQGYKIDGTAGVSMRKLEPLYQKFGFIQTLYPKTDDGWLQVLRSLKHNHPIQIGIKITDVLSGESGGHAIVIEGLATPQWVVIRDSNYNNLELVSTAWIKQAFFDEDRPEFIGVRPQPAGDPLPEGCQ